MFKLTERDNKTIIMIVCSIVRDTDKKDLNQTSGDESYVESKNTLNGISSRLDIIKEK